MKVDFKVYELTDVEIVWAVKNDAIASVFLGLQHLNDHDNV